MKLEDFQSIDWNDFSAWPLFIKVIGVGVIAVAILAGGFWFIIQDEIDGYKLAQEKEQLLRKQFVAKKALAVNLPAYKQQMTDMKQTFGSLLRQLPNSTEVPDLLVDITQAGLGQGLKFNLFKPGKERIKGFYAELPISIQVTGPYHQIAGFVSDVAALPRIVTINNITIRKLGKKSRSKVLSMTATAKTYRYLSSSETKKQKKKKGKRRRRK
ncbi:MAG: type 4a pilus biogenesis protein PilO [Acidiferrobacterales bacterium]